jgi:hypothetical protein
VGAPAVVQRALDYLVGFYLISQELHFGQLVGSARLRCAGNGREDLSLANAVIDGLPVRVLDRGDLMGQSKALDNQFD